MIKPLWPRAPRAAALRALPAVVFTVVFALIVTLAVSAAGYPVRKLNLNDSGVWVTNDADARYGRLNKAVSTLDGLLGPGAGAAGGTTFALDVLQDGFRVVAHDLTSGRLNVIDPAMVAHAEDGAVTIDPAFAVEMRGGTVAALDPPSGKVWAVRASAGVPLDLFALESSQEPLAILGAPAAGATAGQEAGLSVGVDGSVHAVSTNGKRVDIPAHEAGFKAPVTGSGPALKAVQVTAVGTRTAVLDAAAGVLWDADGRAHDIGADVQAQLQAAGPQASEVVVATRNALLAASSSGVRTVSDAPGATPTEPVALGGCVFGAWAGQPGKIVRGCGTAAGESLPLAEGTTLTSPRFRINHDLIVLNDTADGQVYSIELSKFVDNWKEATPQLSTEDGKKRDNPDTDPNRPPKAGTDTLGARPGRTTVLHVLDNDSDPSGRVLMIIGTSQPGGNNSVSVAPDGQSLLFTMPENGTSTSFEYTISNGTAAPVKGTVNVTARGDGDNAVPVLRDGATPLTYPAASWGNVIIPVDGDWRDLDGDPVTVQAATAGQRKIGITADGRLNFVAGKADETAVTTIDYLVSDGRSEPIKGSVGVKVLAHNATSGEASLPQPDAVRGEVGKPIVVEPLKNDVPGADPLNPRAEMALAGKVSPVDGATVETDVKTGQVTITATQPRTYFLDYTNKFGSSKFATGRIRVDVAPTSSGQPPTAMPDTVTVRGQNAAMIDVLANDSDPLGSVLTVQSAWVSPSGGDSEALQVAVLKGRWVRVMPTADDVAPNPSVVNYTISNGVSDPVQGSILVTQVPTPEVDEVMVHDDVAVVRAGDSVLAPVLANDAAESAAALVLDTNMPATTVGQLKVYDPSVASDQQSGDLGTAYVVNDQVRYVAPATVTAPKQIKVEYQASTPSGMPQTGVLTVTVNPAPSEAQPNQAPAPQNVEARAVSGETITIPIVTSGQDPDGDTVQVLGIGSGPQMGRILGYSPQTITYQAYPDEANGGTDTFRYVVTDSWGATEVGTVRVAITPPGETQPPVAVADTVTARPGVEVEVAPMTNDMFNEADRPTIVPFETSGNELPPGVALAGPRGPITARTPGAEAGSLQFAYALTNSGGVGPAASITLQSREGYQNPPRIYDQVAKAQGTNGVVDVLDRAWDADGPESALRVTKVSNPAASMAGGLVSVPLTERLQVVSFEVTDADGATSAGVIYVPAAGEGVPFVKPDSLIKVDQNGSVSVAINDYVLSSRKQQVRLTVAEGLSASPAHLTVVADSADRITVKAAGDYIGPGAVTLEVIDGDVNDPASRKAVVSIPVQVGPATPVLRCPASSQKVVQGGPAVSLRVASLCSVWTPNPEDAASLAFSVEWSKPIGDVTATADGGFIRFTAGSNAVPGESGTARIGVEGTNAVKQEISVSVVAAARAKLVVRNITDVKQGTSVSQSIQMSSPLRQPSFQIVSLEQVGGPAATKSFQGRTFTITPAPTSSGVLQFRLVATDVADKGRTDRHVSGTLSVTVYGVPDKPAPPQPAQQLRSHAASVTFAAPKDNGAPITSFEVMGGGKTVNCGRATRCDITGLDNDTPVQFKVRASNKAGPSAWSELGGSVTPDQIPGRVSGFTASNPADGALTLTWDPLAVDGSKVSTYLVTVNGTTTSVAAPATTTVIRGLNNNNVYTFSIVARNNAGVSAQAATATGQPSGRPVLPSDPKVTASDLGATAQVTVSWAAADPQGPRPVTYTVTRNGSQIYQGTSLSTASTVAHDGTHYTYAVTARNATGGALHTSAARSVTWQATGKPAAWGAWTASATGANGTIDVSYTVPASRGATSKVSLDVNGTPRAMPAGATSTSTPGSTTLTGLTNGTTHSLYLRVCNESNACTQSSTLTAVPYGPLSNPTLSLTRSGNVVSYTASGNGNGKSATLSVSSNRLPARSTTGTGAMTLTDSRDVGYSATVTVTVTLSDGARGTRTVFESITTPPRPPERTVQPYNAGSAGKPSGCENGYYGGGGCRYVGVRTSGFTGIYSCTFKFSRTDGSGISGTLGTQQFTGSGSFRSYYFLGYQSVVTATCDGVSGSVNW